MDYRIEHDSMGEVKVPADKYWGAQTERSHENFPIGVGLETMPREITRAFGVLKLAAARANHALKPEKMTDEKLAAIEQAATEVMEGKLFDAFPPCCLADRLRHAVEHECQRGHRQPRKRDRRQKASAPERRYQHVPVVQRHVPDRDAHCGGGSASKSRFCLPSTS